MLSLELCSRLTSGFYLGLWLIMAAGLVSPALTLAAPAPSPKSPTGGLRLTDAVLLSLRHDPNIESARIATLFERGVLQQARGAFDHALTLQADLSYDRSALTPAELASEESKRRTLRLLTENFNRVADDLELQLEESDSRAVADCGDAEIFIDGQSICPSDRERDDSEALDELLRRLLGIELDPELADLIDGIDSDLSSTSRQLTVDTIETLRASAAGTQLSLDRLGDLPETQFETALTLDLRYEMPLRSGMTFAPGLMLEGTEENFLGKPKRSTFGGKGVVNSYVAIVGFSLNMPIWRGAGRRAATASERSAELNYRASVERMRHTVAARVLGTATAYWDLLAAQERLTLLRRSAATQGRLAEISEALVEAGAVARIDLARSRAELAAAGALVASGERQVARAGLELARIMGLDVARAEEAPRASDPFPEAPEDDGFEAGLSGRHGAWLRGSIAGRHDLQAARLVRDAGVVLRDAAERELRPKLDLELNAGYVGLHEDNNIATGFGEAVVSGGSPGPSATMTLSVDWPSGNNVARGQLRQATALVRRGGVEVRELERRIRGDVLEAAGLLARSAVEIRRREETASYYEATNQAAIETFQAGEAALVDTVLTEQRLTFALLDLVEARRRYATLLARLRFETATLVTWRGEAAQVAPRALVRLPGGDSDPDLDPTRGAS